MRECKHCGVEYDPRTRRGQPGLVTECLDCADESVERYTGNMIYDHKTGGTIQINKDSRITEYINKSTQKHTYGSNMKYAGRGSFPKSNGGCLKTAGEKANAKGKQ